MLNNGFNLPPILSGNENTIEPHTQQSRTLNYLTYAHDWAYSNQIETMGYRRDFVIVKKTLSSNQELWITPKPVIHRVGSGSKPFRLLGGQEVTLSEDDVRVEGISKRYKLEDIWSFGIQYVLNPVLNNQGKIDLERSSTYELVFLDDSHPLTWTLNIRQNRDSRNYGVPLIP